jgi:uncharacterized 2Fe-2S/4Fe-4S cluster protein (DUF4445 family)
MEHTVRMHTDKGITVKKAENGTNLLRFLIDNGAEINAICGGNGKCGKCRVVAEGLAGKPSEREERLLGEKAVKLGYRLACYNSITSDLDIYLDKAHEGARIAVEGKGRRVSLKPSVSKRFISMDRPDLQNQKSDAERIYGASGAMKKINSIDIIRTLPDTVRRGDYQVTLVFIDNELAAVEPGDTSFSSYGIAVDIGTTTIAAYLYDLVSGQRLRVGSVLNPQKKYGADVLSRIDYTLTGPDNLKKMNEVIIECINELIEQIASDSGINKEFIYTCVFVGNTTMTHFLMGANAGNIAVSPFIPVTTGFHRLKAKELGIRVNYGGIAYVFPGVSGYVGADTVAAVLSSGMHLRDEISLLIDIGTNGEIVLGNREWMYACSTAAGPAFEGTNIRNGMGGVKGAIDRVAFDGSLRYSVIGGGKPVGICGSGIVDAVALMLEEGIIDETGRIAGEEERQNLVRELSDRIVEIDGMKAFLLASGNECAGDMDIAVSQKDVREIQNAKAAIAAGVATLVKHAGIRVEEVGKVYLAGGFGSYISIDSALTIGLLPRRLKGRIKSIGNAAGSGACAGLVSSRMFREAERIKSMIEYIELSSSPDFTEEYINSMIFETSAD